MINILICNHFTKKLQKLKTYIDKNAFMSYT